MFLSGRWLSMCSDAILGVSWKRVAAPGQCDDIGDLAASEQEKRPDRRRRRDGRDQGVTAAILVAQLISGARVLPHVGSTWYVSNEQDCAMYSVASQIVDPTASAAL